MKFIVPTTKCKTTTSSPSRSTTWSSAAAWKPLPCTSSGQESAERAVPRSLQRFRFLVGQLARGGAVVVLDGRMRSKWAAAFWRAVPGETTEDWGTYRRWVSETDGGAR